MASPRDDRRSTRARLLRGLAIAVVALVAAVATTIGVALERAHTLRLGACASRERVRFPGPIPAVPQPIAAATAPTEITILPVEIGTPPLRSGLVLTTERRTGAFDVRVQSGAIVRAMDDSFDLLDAGDEAIVPAWSRDVLVPWGWDGPWIMGQRACRQLQMTGWPWPALASIASSRIELPTGPTAWIPVEGFGVAIKGQDAAFWPTRILWPGFLADVLVYWIPWWIACAAIFWGVTIAWRAQRARWRRRRHLCTACAYPLSASTGAPLVRCPECGASNEPAIGANR